MASPQVEDGFTRIANELLEQLVLRVRGQKLTVVLFIIRETYGRGVKARHFSLDCLEEGTGIDRGDVSRAVRELLNLKILGKSQPENIGKFPTKKSEEIGLQKDYERWGIPKFGEIPTNQVGEIPTNSAVVRTSFVGVVGPSKKKERKKGPPIGPPKRILTDAPEAIEITEAMRAWFRKSFGEVPSREVLSQTQLFLDHHRAQGSRFRDWTAAWRKWMRNWRTEFGKRVPEIQSNGRPRTGTLLDNPEGVRKIDPITQEPIPWPNQNSDL